VNLTALVRLAESTMTETAVVERKARDDDGAGGLIESFEMVTQPDEALRAGILPCSISPTARSTADERIIAERLEVLVPYTLRFPNGADVRIGDRVAVDGRHFMVRAFNQSTHQVELKVVCSEVGVG
jgi:hypothetical protein